eukprot:g1610.t1
MLGRLEAAMRELLVPDTTRVKNATRFITQCLKFPNVLLVLFGLVEKSQSVAVRQMAAVFVRRKIQSFWKSLAPQVVAQAQTMLLQRLTNDPAKIVRKAIASAVAAMGKMKVQNGGQCNAIFQFMITSSRSPKPIDREMSMLLFYFLGAEVGDSPELAGHYDSLRDLFMRCLQDNAISVKLMALKAISQLVGHLSVSEEVLSFKAAIPHMLNALKHAIDTGEDGAAIMAFDVVSQLAECPIPLLNTYFEPLMKLVMMTASSGDNSEEVRNSALMVFSAIVSNHPRAVQRIKHLQGCIEALVQVLCKCEAEAATQRSQRIAKALEAGVQMGGDETGTAQYALDCVALSLPSNMIFQTVAKCAFHCVKSVNPSVRAGGLIALSVIAEGCVRATRENLETLLPIAMRGVADAASPVRRAACVCIGQWLEQLGRRGMSDYHSAILPSTLRLLTDSDASVQEAAMFVWEGYADLLSPDEIRPYVKPLMNQLTRMLNSDHLRHQIMAITSIGACAVASKVEFLPFFERVIVILKQAMAATDNARKMLCARALECCGQVAVAVGPKAFGSHMNVCVQLAVNATKLDDVMLEDHAITFFANVCVCFGPDFRQIAVKLLPYLMQTIALNDIIE